VEVAISNDGKSGRSPACSLHLEVGRELQLTGMGHIREYSDVGKGKRGEIFEHEMVGEGRTPSTLYWEDIPLAWSSRESGNLNTRGE